MDKVNISIETILTILGLFGTVAFTWGFVRNKVDNLEKADDETNENLEKETRNIWNEISKIRSWKDDHEKESANQFIEIQKDLSKIREYNGIKDGKIDEVIRRLETMDKKLDKLETDNFKK